MKKTGKSKKLTPRQKLFVREYLVDLNATKAAERAGYSKNTAQSQGSFLLSNPIISAAVAEKTSARLEKLDITADRVLQELALLGFSNMMDYIRVLPNGDAKVDLSRLDREKAAAIGEISVDEVMERNEDGEFERVKKTKFKLADKRGALVDLGKHLKLFTDKCEVTGKDGGPIQVEAVGRMSDEQIRRELEIIASRARIGSGASANRPAITAGQRAAPARRN